MKNVLFILSALMIFSCSKTKSTNEVDSVPEESTVVAAASDSSYVFFKYPSDNAKVSSPVFVEMGVSGMEIEPAGQVKEGFGHHHILINQTGWPEGQVIPMSDSTFHYGKGQTDASLDLDPGTYTLTLQLANGVHSSYGASMATSIVVVVE